ncbi:hypothetical protein [Kitasatospora herbaricolor]|uniref:Uncharacterized protein n=1 Tax=Kitasatospora herbaricolor TaxID=68217 RepID=A0ABZ1W205_9ACTN|nr:hypothetical protein [Kitasatospora herbaricolor]
MTAVVAIVLLVVAGTLATADSLVKVPSADRSSVVAGRSAIKEWSTTNPGGGDEYQVTYLVLPSLTATDAPVPAEVGRLVAAGWAVQWPEGPDGTASLLSPGGKSRLTLESTGDFLRRSAEDLSDELARRETAPSAESNPGAVMAILERIAR